MKYIKTFESVARAKSFISNKMEQYEKLKDILKKNHGYIGQMTEWLFDEKIPLGDLESMYKRIIELKLSGKPISIDGKSYDKVIDEVMHNEVIVKILRIVNKMSPNSKSFVKADLDNKSSSIFSIFERLTKKTPEIISKFLSRSASFKSPEDIEAYYKILDIGVINKREHILGVIKSLKNTKVLYDKNNILVAQVGTYEDIKVLGNDCTWCIVQYNSSWINYTAGGYQLIVWDFNKEEFDSLFKIGITMTKQSEVYTAFDYRNKNCNEYAKKLLEEIKIKPSKEEEKERITRIINSLISDIRYTSTLKSIKEVYDKIQRAPVENDRKPLFINFVDNFFRSLKINELGVSKKAVTDAKIEYISKSLGIIFKNMDIVTEDDLNKISPNIYKYILRNYEGFGSIKPIIYDETYHYSKNIFIKEKIVDKIGDDDFKNLLYETTDIINKMSIKKLKIDFIELLKLNEPPTDMEWTSFKYDKTRCSILYKIYNRAKKIKSLHERIEYILLSKIFNKNYKLDASKIKEEYKMLYWYILRLPFSVEGMDISSIPYIMEFPISLININKPILIFKMVYGDENTFSLILELSEMVDDNCMVYINPDRIRTMLYFYDRSSDKSKFSELEKQSYEKLKTYGGKFIKGEIIELNEGKLFFNMT
jgi:hypothetical protein